ncbi:2Fe-2S iron-sulfur cluster-binding protein [Pseudonocardia sp. T1-2H]|uniref:2Fe-2S iron-sulfur cluster-binding protein n=1 Tax=Pseudonocardia sp. T1-2H TaxID=3128899 RepID=UPI0031016249
MTATEGPDAAGAPPARRLTCTVNGQHRTVECEDRQLLVEVIREQLNLKGTHIGCLNGDCGACTVELDGHIIAGNLCRCTGYQRIDTSIRDAAARSRASGS